MRRETEMPVDRQKGAVRPLWLTLGVLTCVVAGTTLNKCLCDPEKPATASAGVVQGDLIMAAAKPAADVDPRRGAYYGISGLGREVLVAEAGRLADLVEATEELGLIPDRGHP